VTTALRIFISTFAGKLPQVGVHRGKFLGLVHGELRKMPGDKP
jgi:hypothetical protein